MSTKPSPSKPVESTATYRPTAEYASLFEIRKGAPAAMVARLLGTERALDHLDDQRRAGLELQAYSPALAVGLLKIYAGAAQMDLKVLVQQAIEKSAADLAFKATLQAELASPGLTGYAHHEQRVAALLGNWHEMLTAPMFTTPQDSAPRVALPSAPPSAEGRTARGLAPQNVGPVTPIQAPSKVPEPAETAAPRFGWTQLRTSFSWQSAAPVLIGLVIGVTYFNRSPNVTELDLPATSAPSASALSAPGSESGGFGLPGETINSIPLPPPLP